MQPETDLVICSPDELTHMKLGGLVFEAIKKRNAINNDDEDIDITLVLPDGRGLVVPLTEVQRFPEIFFPLKKRPLIEKTLTVRANKLVKVSIDDAYDNGTTLHLIDKELEQLVGKQVEVTIKEIA